MAHQINAYPGSPREVRWQGQETGCYGTTVIPPGVRDDGGRTRSAWYLQKTLAKKENDSASNQGSQIGTENLP